MTEGQSWTLIARVSNKGEKHWTWYNGWWNKYDMTDAKGKTTDPLDGEDMISPAFWLVGGKGFMITRSDDPHTAPLLQTTDDCLDEQTFRDKIQTSKGRLIHNQCRSSCNVRYGGQYETTEGFEQASENGCSPANLQTGNKIGFWCNGYTADYKLKVARYSFSGSIPLKREHKLRRQKQSFGKIATTVVLDNDENLL